MTYNISSLPTSKDIFQSSDQYGHTIAFQSCKKQCKDDLPVSLKMSMETVIPLSS